MQNSLLYLNIESKNLLELIFNQGEEIKYNEHGMNVLNILKSTRDKRIFAFVLSKFQEEKVLNYIDLLILKGNSNDIIEILKNISIKEDKKLKLIHDCMMLCLKEKNIVIINNGINLPKLIKNIASY